MSPGPGLFQPNVGEGGTRKRARERRLETFNRPPVDPASITAAYVAAHPNDPIPLTVSQLAARKAELEPGVDTSGWPPALFEDLSTDTANLGASEEDIVAVRLQSRSFSGWTRDPISGGWSQTGPRGEPGTGWDPDTYWRTKMRPEALIWLPGDPAID